MIPLEEAKLYLRADCEPSVEDPEVQHMLDAATAAALDYLNRESFDGEMPAPVRAAILLQVADLYVNRERQMDQVFYQNRTYERLLNPYRVLDL